MVLLQLLSISCYINAQSHYPGQHQGKIVIVDKPLMKAYSFNLEDVRLLDSPFKENMERDCRWILSINVNSLLHSFRNNSGLYSANEGGYFYMKKLGGWESLDCDLRGHTAGHILSALAQMYASTGNDVYKQKADSLVKGLGEVQKALHQNGYLSAFPQQLIDRAINGQPVWAPWYTLHKILAGLLDQYLYCNNQQALEIAKGMASWAYTKLTSLPKEQITVMLRNEFGGINDAFFNLYAITGNPEHKSLAEIFYHQAVLEPLARQEDNLDGKHANTFIPKVVGEARSYELSDNAKDKTIAQFYWNTIIEHQTFCTGSNSDREKFIAPNKLSEHLSGYTGESCNVYGMLKLTRHLFCWEPDVKYADYYEQALYNHILGQQDPATGMITYFLPMLPGAHKVYSTPDSSFWCCVGSGFENQAKYGEAIYYHTDRALYVNLFIPSELTWKEKGVKVCQETQFPNGETTTLTIETDQKTDMPLYVRYPSWATSGAIYKINGKIVKTEQKPGSYVTLNRKWSNGDKIEITYPMHIRVVPSDNDTIVAFAYGPIVLAGMMGTEGMAPPAPYSNPKLHNDYYTYDFYVPSNLVHRLKLDKRKLNNFMMPVPGTSKLTFKTKNEGITLEPLYLIHHQRYVVYWNVEK